MLTIDLKQMIRTVPDFPKPGINFFDITTLLKEPDGLKATIDSLATPYAAARIDAVVGIESRGFILGAAVAQRIGAGFIAMRVADLSIPRSRFTRILARSRSRGPGRRHHGRDRPDGVGYI